MKSRDRETQLVYNRYTEEVYEKKTQFTASSFRKLVSNKLKLQSIFDPMQENEKSYKYFKSSSPRDQHPKPKDFCKRLHLMHKLKVILTEKPTNIFGW